MTRLDRRTRIAALAIGAALLSACTQFGPYRTTTLAAPTYAVVDCRSGPGDGSMPACEAEGPGTYAIQRRHYRYQHLRPNDTTESRTGTYHMAFVEFDDQGWFAEPSQMQALFMLLQKLEEHDRHALILVYAHGWKHNAHRCDNNVHCFGRLVERMDILERHLEDAIVRRAGLVPKKDDVPRHVVAVYVGWRGLSLKGRVLANLSFWTRKATAERVGRGGVKELLTRLDEYRRSRNPGRDEAKTQLAIAGHSFGGLVVYSALSHALMERASQVHREGTATRYNVARSFGDFIVLVNPAFEGSLYEPLYHVAANRCYSPSQRPVILTVTSVCDGATGSAFPFGRAVSTVFEHAGSATQQSSLRNTVGHNARYETHRLEWKDEQPPTRCVAAPPPREPAETECGCPHLEPTQSFRWWDFVGVDPRDGGKRPLPLVSRPTTETGRAVETPPPVRPMIENGRRVYRVYGDDVALSGDMKYSANYPYLVVRADSRIVADHNAIYSEPFVEFLHKFFLLHIANARPYEADVCHREFAGCQPDGPLPCERACQLADGHPCTRQD